jgi:type II secretory pathway component PulF
MFSRRMSNSDVIDLCRVLRHQLSAGMTVHQVLKKQAERGRSSIRAVARRMSDSLQQGNSLAAALDDEPGVFPVLFLSMVKLGEESGHLAEIFGELERYYQLEHQLRRRFRSQTFFPIVQFVFAVAIIAGLILFLGMINPANPLLTFFGISGAKGAAAFLLTVTGSLALVWFLYLTIARAGRQRAWMDRLLQSLPVLGPCLHAILMSRLTLALQLTLDSGLPIARALQLSFEATGNAHFVSRLDGIVRSLRNGKPLYDALAASQLFSPDFLDMVISSEASGSVPEMMKHLAQEYQDDAERRMTTLAKFAGGAVWCCVAGFIILAIFKLYGAYFEALGGIR